MDHFDIDEEVSINRNRNIAYFLDFNSTEAAPNNSARKNRLKMDYPITIGTTR